MGALPEDAMATIETVDCFNKLFDLLNSSHTNNSNEFKNVFIGSDFQMDFLIKMAEFIGKMRILNNRGDDVTAMSKFKVCWLITINGIIQLWTTLQQTGFKYLKTRSVNQDCIENFFGSIRQQGGNSLNPTPVQFQRAFKKLFAQSYLHTFFEIC